MMHRCKRYISLVSLSYSLPFSLTEVKMAEQRIVPDTRNWTETAERWRPVIWAMCARMNPGVFPAEYMSALDSLEQYDLLIETAMEYRRMRGWFVFVPDVVSVTPPSTPVRPEPGTPRYPL